MKLASKIRTPRYPQLVGEGHVTLSVRDIAVKFRTTDVLRGVDLDVRTGEVLVLVGPNGAGKSTLLSVISGDIDPDRGEVLVEDEPLSHWSTVELAMRRAVLLQQIQLSFPFTVHEVVKMGRAPWANTPAEDFDDEVVAWAMKTTDVEEFTDRVFMSLSGGERARAALARVLAQDARTLLLDEPTAAMDIRHQEHVMQIAKARAQAGDAVVVVMHDLGVAAAHADRVVVLSNGLIVADGSPTEVMTADLLGEVYQCPIEVIPNPRTGSPVIIPLR